MDNLVVGTSLGLVVNLEGVLVGLLVLMRENPVGLAFQRELSLSTVN